MKLWKLLTIATNSTLVAGITTFFALSLSSCDKSNDKGDGDVFLVNSQEAIFNKATFNFAFRNHTPENISFAWINKPEEAKRIKIVNNNNILVDPNTSEFSLELEVLVQPKDWSQISFGVSFQYDLDGASHYSRVFDLVLNNGTTQTDAIHQIYGRTKMITTIDDEANFTYKFDKNQPEIIPSKIDKVDLIDLPTRLQDIVQLPKPTDIEIDPETLEFNIPIKLTKEIDEIASFSLRISYDYGDKKVCYYSDTLSLILYKIEPGTKLYMSMKVVPGKSGNISYTQTLGQEKIEKNLFYSINGSNYWSYLPLDEKIHLDSEDVISFCGINDTWSSKNYQYSFVVDTDVMLYGSPESLIHGGIVQNTLSGSYCFTKLFKNCSNILSVNSDFLPMHTLTEHCFDGMFDGCSKLTCENQFKLPAKTLANDCYKRLFAGTQINNIKYYDNHPLSIYYTFEWLDGCTNNGMVWVPSDVDLSSVVPSVSTIPTNWQSGAFDEPLTILSKGKGFVMLCAYRPDDTIDIDYVWDQNKNLSYTYNYPNEELKQITSCHEVIELKEGEYIYLQGNNPNGWYNLANEQETRHIGFYVNCPCNVNGMVMSLIDSKLQTKIIPFTEDKMSGFPCLFSGSLVENIGSKVLYTEETLPAGCFRKIFSNCTNLTDIGNIIDLIQTLDLKPYCCEEMFDGCTSITTLDVDKIAITDKTLPTSCFQGMFRSCVNLLAAPQIGDNESFSSDFSPHCLSQMFANCINLKYSGDIYGKNAAEYCCFQMFMGCHSLSVCPELLFTNIEENDNYCFCGMFRDCTWIKDIPTLEKHCWPAGSCESMFQGCTRLECNGSSPHFIHLSKNQIYGTSFKKMFYGCNNLLGIYIDLDGWGKEFATLPDFSSIFEDWLPTEFLHDRTVWLRNHTLTQDDINAIPDAFAPEAGGWVKRNYNSTLMIDSFNISTPIVKFDNMYS